MSRLAVDGPRGAGAAYARFKEAVLDLSDDPTKANIARYLHASRVLDGETPQESATRHSKRIGQGSGR